MKYLYRLIICMSVLSLNSWSMEKPLKPLEDPQKWEEMLKDLDGAKNKLNLKMKAAYENAIKEENWSNNKGLYDCLDNQAFRDYLHDKENAKNMGRREAQDYLAMRMDTFARNIAGCWNMHSVDPQNIPTQLEQIPVQELQREDIIAEANKDPENYWICDALGRCFNWATGKQKVD